MRTDDHFQRLVRMYASAPINELYAPELEVGDGSARIRVEVTSRLFHAAHAVHGSVYFKLLDDAAWFSAASRVEDYCLVTSQFSIHLLRPVTQGSLIAQGTVVQASLRLFVAAAELRDQRGRIVATGSGSFVRSGIPLDEQVGYR